MNFYTIGRITAAMLRFGPLILLGDYLAIHSFRSCLPLLPLCFFLALKVKIPKLRCLHGRFFVEKLTPWIVFKGIVPTFHITMVHTL